MYEEYKDKGFVVLAFPSNQFGAQEPGSNAEIKAFACSRYKATFPLFAKVDVNGANTAPVYQFLKGQKGGGLLGDGIKWNFGKFLVDKTGNVVERYAPTTSPNSIKVGIRERRVRLSSVCACHNVLLLLCLLQKDIEKLL